MISIQLLLSEEGGGQSETLDLNKPINELKSDISTVDANKHSHQDFQNMKK